MAPRDFALMVFICLIWASNNIIAKYAVTHLEIPPMFFSAIRFVIVAVAAAPWLLPMPKPRGRLLAVALLMGGGNFALVFMALKTASASSVAVVSQLGVPITTLMSVVILGETIHWRIRLGIILTFAGAMVVMWDPKGFETSPGLLYVVLACFLASLGAVMMKQIQGIRPLQFQAWVGFSSIWPLALASLLFETGQVAAAQSGWMFWAIVSYSALVCSVLAHTIYYVLIRRYEANLISPLTLMTPLATIIAGVALFQDDFGPRMAIGTAVALGGVLIIALRKNQVAPWLMAFRNRTP